MNSIAYELTMTARHALLVIQSNPKATLTRIEAEHLAKRALRAADELAKPKNQRWQAPINSPTKET